MLETFLSEDIHNFIKICANYSNNLNNNYISTDLIINWENINIFSDYAENFVIHDQTEEWYLEQVKLIHEITSEAMNRLKNASDKTIAQLWERSSWTERTTDIVNCFNYFTQNTQSSLLKCVLIFTSLLERSLGNVYRINNKNVPFLLKELLESDYLHSLLGNKPILLMQILFGTSKILNLRNIAWHGFLSTNELKQNHIAVLFILIASLGDILKIKELERQHIPCRPQITNISQRIEEIESRNKLVNIFSFTEDLTQILNLKTFIGDTHKEFWEEIVFHKQENCNNYCVLLLLPLLEHLLRRIFCKINVCNERNIFASRKEKYVTLDEIFAEDFEEKPNKLLELLNRGSIDFYNDLFSQLSGPRIRDKFSHGEIVLQNLPCRLTELLLNLTLYILLKTNEHFNLNEIKLTLSLSTELETCFQCYESLYHPNIILKYKILDALNSVGKLVNIPKPKESEIEKCDIETNEYCYEEVTNKCIEIFHCNLKEFVEKLNIPTICRPEEEIKLIKKLIKISNNIIDICSQIISDNDERYTLFTNNSLSSRQINRYDEIMQSIVIVYETLNCIIHIATFLMQKQFSRSERNFKFDIKIFRFLRETLKFEDKIYHLSYVKINKWKQVRTLSTCYGKQLKYIFKKHMKNM